LVLRPDGSDRLAYALLRADGPRLGDAEMRFDAAGSRRLDGVVGDLASGAGGEVAADLLPYGVRFVLLSRSADSAGSRALVRALDSVPRLVPLSGSARFRTWKVDVAVGRVRVIGAPGAASATSSEQAEVLPAGPVDVRAKVSSSATARWVVLADSRNPGWHATLEGKRLTPRTYDGWAQAFVLPKEGGTLEIGFDQGWRTVLLWVQLLGLILCVVLTFPSARSRDEGEDAFNQADAAPVGRRRQPAQVRS